MRKNFEKLNTVLIKSCMFYLWSYWSYTWIDTGDLYFVSRNINYYRRSYTNLYLWNEYSIMNKKQIKYVIKTFIRSLIKFYVLIVTL